MHEDFENTTQLLLLLLLKSMLRTLVNQSYRSSNSFRQRLSKDNKAIWLRVEYSHCLQVIPQISYKGE